MSLVRTTATVLAGAAIALVAMQPYRSTAKSTPSAAVKNGDTPRAVVSLRKIDRGSTRLITASAFISDADPEATGTITSEFEVDATDISYTLYPSGTPGATGQVNGYIQMNGDVYQANALVSQRETVAFSFETPVPIRADDAIRLFNSGGNAGSGTLVEVTVLGRIPAAVRTEGMSVH